MRSERGYAADADCRVLPLSGAVHAPSGTPLGSYAMIVALHK